MTLRTIAPPRAARRQAAGARRTRLSRGDRRAWHVNPADSGTTSESAGAKIACRIARGPKDLFDAFSLVYNAYLGRGLVRPNPYRMRVTPFHLLDSTEIFVAVQDGRVISTVSLVRDGELGLPMESIYEYEVLRLRHEGLYLAEVSSLADQGEGTKATLPVVMRLMGLMAQCARERGVDQLLITVHPRHVRFYERFTAFRPIGELKTYEAVCDNPAVALALDLNRAPFDHPYEYEKFFGIPFAEEELQYRPVAEHILDELRPVAEVCCGGLGTKEWLEVEAA